MSLHDQIKTKSLLMIVDISRDHLVVSENVALTKNTVITN